MFGEPGQRSEFRRSSSHWSGRLGIGLRLDLSSRSCNCRWRRHGRLSWLHGRLCWLCNSLRFYEEPQLLTLQQILFYRELGLELKQIKQVLGRAELERVAALQSHRQVLEEKLTRTRSLDPATIRRRALCTAQDVRADRCRGARTTLAPRKRRTRRSM